MIVTVMEVGKTTPKRLTIRRRRKINRHCLLLTKIVILDKVIFNSLITEISVLAFKTNFVYVQEQTEGLRALCHSS